MNDTIQPYTTPVLLNQVIQQLQDQFAQLTWLETVYPLVQVGQRQVQLNGNERRVRYPQVYRNDGKTYQHFISPDRSAKSFCFFELNAPYSFDFNDLLIRTGQAAFNLNIVVWLNLPKIDPQRAYDFTEELIQDFVQHGLMASVHKVSIQDLFVERRQELIFNRYDYSIAEEQFLIFPYSGFKVTLTLNSGYNVYCVPQWETLPEA